MPRREERTPATRTATPETVAVRAPRWHDHLLRAAEQSLDDLARSGASEVVLVRPAKEAASAELPSFVADLGERAERLGFVTAEVVVSKERSFESLEAVVEAVLRSLRPTPSERDRGGGSPGKTAPIGFVALLDRFLETQAKAPLEELSARLEAHHLAGDLATLARAYAAAKGAARTERRRIEAWLSGTDLTRADEAAPSLAPLSKRTSKRLLVELTRLVVALGWRGTLLVFSGGEALAALPPARRHAAYTVLRELVDNADGGRGLASTAIVVTGAAALFTGARSMASLPPLAARLDRSFADPSAPPAPHRSLVDLAPPGAAIKLPPLPETRPVKPASAAALHALIRGAHGLPPTDATLAWSVGHERIDHAIDALFEHSRIEGSVFSLLTGQYGAGKTHFMLHLAARAQRDRRPVFRLSLEQLDLDLGHPERHLRRLLEQATLPSGVGPLDRLLEWTRTARGLDTLRATLRAIGEDPGDASDAASKALSIAEKAKRPGLALEAYFGAVDLEVKACTPAVRRDAYSRLLLWLALLERIEGCAGPVLLLDEAENLYRGGTSRPERRTALRSLSFYCGGALPRACVVMAITPEALLELEEEAPTLLGDIAEQKTILAWEDASMFCRRLKRARPLAVPSLSREQRAELAGRVRATHALARGPAGDPGWEAFVGELVGQSTPPRGVVRRVVERLESLWWSGGAG